MYNDLTGILCVDAYLHE